MGDERPITWFEARARPLVKTSQRLIHSLDYGRGWADIVVSRDLEQCPDQDMRKFKSLAKR